ncbi:hypothetical protein NUU61_000144 [Penicillium alfredii]|uniref:Ankyrin repeat protein n=1 Tax=Penicillium alfredii TaxID=1506179 RepID=A0A9W9G903_9EURO|nr:uncharacterized protein NUU61_000144 [Penicillium alfredii]KAJ5114385.1 hypothetical protein NUU61_000144 [Penicillium alfredii]
MMDLYQDILDGTLTEARLRQYLEKDRTALEKQGPGGLTPLGAATVAGYADGVLLLLNSGAKADSLSKDGETPLLLAASKTNRNRARIIQLLLAKTPASAIDATSPSAANHTPLMYVVQKRDVESIRLLRKAGASLTLTNDDGYNADDLAAKTDDRVVKRALNPEKEKVDFKMLVDMVVGLLLFIVAWVNKVTDKVVRRMYGLDNDMDDAWNQRVNGGEVTTTGEFVAKVDNVVKDSPLERFFEGKEDFIQEVAKNVVELENDTSTSLGRPDLLPKTIKVSLHQQVIYCGKSLDNAPSPASSDSDQDGIDDSSSMKREGRWDSQKNLVERIARITTREVSNSTSLRLSGIGNILEGITWGGDTEIGTYLKSKILKPLVYDKLDLGPKGLARPLLISIITDGGPEPEPYNTLRDTIMECRQKLDAAKYPQDSVKFVIGQVGTSKPATQFLASIRNSTEIADMVYCTSEQLDERFKKERENDAKLDRWLIETLFEPLKDRELKLKE